MTLDAAVAAGDAKTVVATCHKLSGVASVFGYPAIGEMARGIEGAVKKNGLSDDSAAQTTALAAELSAVAEAT